MKEKISSLLARLPLIIFLSTAWSVYSWYEGIESKRKELDQKEQSIKAMIAKDEKWLKGIREFLDNIDKEEERVKAVEAQIDKVQKQLPTNVSDTEILEYLARETELMNLQKVALEPKEEILNGFYFAKQFELKAVGTFHQFLVLFERMADAERLFNVKELKIRPTDSRFRGRFQMLELFTIIESFRYNENYRVGASNE